MRLGAEELLKGLGLTKDYFAVKSNKSDLNIVADTIVPTTPIRVEEVVPVRNSAEHTQGEQNGNQAVNEAAQEGSHTNATRHTSDTARQTPHRSKDETPTAETTRIDSAISTPIRTSAPATTIARDTLPTVISRQVFTTDSISYPVAIDSLVIDTVSVAETKGISSYTLDGQKEGVALPVKLDRSDGIFALLLVCFLLLAHVYNGGFAFFKENIMLVFSSTKSDKLETQTTTKEIFYSYFLVFLAVLLISISLYEALDRFMPLGEGAKRPFVTIGLFIALILLFILVKMIFNKLVGYIFDFDKRLNTWNRSYLVLLSILGLLCFLPTLMLVYSSLWHSIIIGFVLVLFLIVQVVLFLRIIVFFIGQKFNFLFLIAYLCTIEILPYIFLGIGLVYLYRIDIFNTIL